MATAIERVESMANALMDRTHTPEQHQRIRDLFVVHEGDSIRTSLGKPDDWDPATITEEEKAKTVLAVMYRAAYSVMGNAARRQAQAAVVGVEDQVAAELRAAMGVE